MARRTAAAIGQRGFTIITGGGPGSMEAANRGARDVGALSIGLSIELPAEQEINPYVDLAIEFKHFFIRKIMFVRYASAFVVLPGGLGTLDELFEAHTAHPDRQGPALPGGAGRLRVLGGPARLGARANWSTAARFSAETLDLLHVVDDPDEVAAVVEAGVDARS